MTPSETTDGSSPPLVLAVMTGGVVSCIAAPLGEVLGCVTEAGLSTGFWAEVAARNDGESGLAEDV